MSGPVHPAMALQHRCLTPLGLAWEDAASALGVNQHEFAAFMNGERSVTTEWAVRLGTTFGKVSGLEVKDWLQMQADYYVGFAMQQAGQIQDRVRVNRVFQPVKDPEPEPETTPEDEEIYRKVFDELADRAPPLNKLCPKCQHDTDREKSVRAMRFEI